MNWVWGDALSVTENLFACPRCGAAVSAGHQQQHHSWHGEAETA